MKKIGLVAMTMAMLFVWPSMAQEVKFDVAKSELKWTGKKVAGAHWGFVTLKSGALTLKNDKISSGKFVIDMTTINVKDLEPGEWNQKLEAHLKNDDFFGVDKFPTATLEITQSDAFVKNEANVSGKLTIKGITQPINFKALKTNTGYSATITVDRTKYGVRYGSGQFFQSLGDNMIYDDFTLEVKLVKQ
jgi:polyisoprenoid-binding protein YceI